MNEFEISDHDVAMCQSMADALWAVATSNNSNVAHIRSGVFVAMDTAFKQALWHTYSLDDDQCQRVRDLLAQYGPDDKLQGTVGRGVASYVHYVQLYDRAPA